MVLRLDRMGLSPLQKERLIFLLGSRYKGSPKVKITVSQYKNFEENYFRALDIIKQLYWEALRAPDFQIEKMRPRERRKYLTRYLGKGDERKKNLENAEKQENSIQKMIEESKTDKEPLESYMNKRLMNLLREYLDEIKEKDAKNRENNFENNIN